MSYGRSLLSEKTWGKIMHITMKLGSEQHCTYCGAKPSGYDHVIPVSFQNSNSNLLRTSNVRNVKRFGVTVYSCDECNNLLGNNIFCSFYERCQFVRKKLEKRYRKKIRAIASFDNEELEEYGPNLKKYLSDSKVLLKLLERRLSFQDSYDFFLIFKSIQDDVSHEMFPKREFWMEFFQAK